MRFALPIAVATLMLAGCAAQQHQSVIENKPATFDPLSVAWSKKSGVNMLLGSAALPQQKKTCANLPVRLAPDSEYTRDRIGALYGNTNRGYVSIARAEQIRSQTVPSDPEYNASLRVANCDAKGNFIFRKLPDGTYYVLAPVTWSGANGANEGGFMMERVEVQGGMTRQVMLTP